jgi:hypothetical protein
MGISLTNMAKYLKCAKSYLSRLERGMAVWTPDIYSRYSKGLYEVKPTHDKRIHQNIHD